MSRVLRFLVCQMLPDLRSHANALRASSPRFSRAPTALCRTCSCAFTCLTFSRDLCTLHALVPYVPCVIRALMFYVLCASLLPHVLRVLRFSRASCASYLSFSSASCTSCLKCSRVFFFLRTFSKMADVCEN